jgi:hypothetical protein
MTLAMFFVCLWALWTVASVSVEGANRLLWYRHQRHCPYCRGHAYLGFFK